MELIGLLLVVAAVYFFIKLSHLSDRVKELETRLGSVKNPASSAQASLNPAISTVVSMDTAHTTTPIPPRYAGTSFAPTSAARAHLIEKLSKEDLSFDIVAWIKQDFLVKLGAFLLLLAFGWFVSYAFANNWVGPVGRIMLGLLAGLCFMVLGIWRIRLSPSQGSIFVVLGSTIVLFTVNAARVLYDIFTPATALLIMFMSVVLVAFVAVQYKRTSVAIAGLILGAVAPFFTNTPDPSVVVLFSYLLVLVLGSLWVMRSIGAVALPVISFFIVASYGVPYLFGNLDDPESSMALLFAFLFTAIFFVSNIASILKRNDSEARQAHVILAIGTGIYLAGWIAVATEPAWHSLLYTAWALVFCIGSLFVYTHTNQKAPFYIYSAVAVGLIAAATAAELSGPVLVIVYTVQVTFLMAVVSKVFKDYDLLKRTSFLFVGPILLSIENLISSSWNYGFIHGDFFALFVVMLGCLMATVLILDSRPRDVAIKTDAATVFGVVAGLYAVALIWLVTHAIFLDQVATTVSLVVYTLIGLSLYIAGRRIAHDTLRTCGALLIGMVVLRLLVIDVWEMPLAGRIITFFIIGILLLSTAFINKKLASHQ